jgi:branched-chain amino acid aminotransferase
MINLYRVDKTDCLALTLPDMASLDAITRQLPDGYYSTFRTYDACTRVIGLSAHLRRLPTVDASSLRRNLLQLLEPFRPGEARVRVMETKQGQFYISIEPLKLLPQAVYEQGVRVETTDIQRGNPRAKSTAFIGASDAERKHLAQAGIFEALLVKNGRILEGMTSNFFYVGQVGNLPYLGTARNEILLGITRTMVIRAARGRGVEVRYSPLKLNQLPAVREAFITSSSRGVVPVIQIDEVRVGQGRPGKTTQLLMQAYAEYVLKHAEKI